MEDQAPPPSTEELLAEMRRRVEDRRSAGEYPEGLEDELDAHFRRVLGAPGRPRMEELEDLRRRLRDTPEVSAGASGTAAGLANGQSLRSTVGRVVGREVAGMLRLSDSLNRVIDLLIDEATNPTHVHVDLAALVDSLVERQAASDRAPASSAAAAELYRRLAALESRSGSWAAATGIDPQEVRAAVVGPLPGEDSDPATVLQGCDPVLVIAAGNAGDGDLLDELDRAAQASLGGVLAIGWRDLCGPADSLRLVLAAFDALRPAGRMAVFADNPRSPAVVESGLAALGGLGSMVDPGYLQFLAERGGFGQVRWHPVPEGDRESPAYCLLAQR